MYIHKQNKRIVIYNGCSNEQCHTTVTVAKHCLHVYHSHLFQEVDRHTLSQENDSARHSA